jgi:hypothetical protein
MLADATRRRRLIGLEADKSPRSDRLAIGYGRRSLRDRTLRPEAPDTAEHARDLVKSTATIAYLHDLIYTTRKKRILRGNDAREAPAGRGARRQHTKPMSITGQVYAPRRSRWWIRQAVARSTGLCSREPADGLSCEIRRRRALSRPFDLARVRASLSVPDSASEEIE